MQYTSFTPKERDALIGLSFSRAQRNMYGDLGPRHYPCSGLGSIFLLGGGRGAQRQEIVQAPVTCSCGGAGIDFDALERMDPVSRWVQSMNAIESRYGLPLTSLHQMPTIKNSKQHWMECLAWATVDGTAIASSAAESLLFPNVTIPANYMADGRCLRLHIKGKFSTLGSGTVTHVYQIRWGGLGGTMLCKSGTVTLLVSLTTALFEIDAELQTRSNGAGGTIMANGRAIVHSGTAPTIGSATGAPAIAALTNGGQTGPAAATVDLTVDTSLAVTLQHGASSASNTATGLQYTIESRN